MYAHAIEDHCGHTRATPPSLLLPEDLRGRRAVVTGAARGIGEAIAKWLIMAGADVTVVDKDQESLKLAFGAEPCQILKGDLAADDVAGLAYDLTRHEPVELIVNNVGVSTRHGFLDIGPLEFDEVLQTNLRGPWFFTRRLVDALVDAQRHETDGGRGGTARSCSSPPSTTASSPGGPSTAPARPRSRCSTWSSPSSSRRIGSG